MPTGEITLKHDELMAYGWFSIESLTTMQSALRTEVVLRQAQEVLAALASHNDKLPDWVDMSAT